MMDFEALVEEALALIPSELRARICNVQIIIQDEPSVELLAELGLPINATLYGVYSGTPLTERTTEYAALPDCIVIYRRPLLANFADPVALRRQVARTVIHELAHHFGITDERLGELGWS